MREGATRSRRPALRLVAVLVVVLILGTIAVAIAASGGDSRPKPCAVILNGQKLCSHDLADYCRLERGFGPLNDAITAAACKKVGVAARPASP